MAKYNGSGWKGQTTRHSNARRTGKAGGTYSTVGVWKKDKFGLNAEKVGDFTKKEAKMFDKSKFNIMEYKGLAKPMKDSDKDGVPDKYDCQPHNPNKQDNETAGEVLKRLSNSESSSEEDGRIMQAILHRLGFERAVVTVGVVYLDGKGTMQNPPASIHSVAKTLIKAVDQTKR
jgi:hypothetical protein